MRAIARKAGVSLGNAYHYFGSKEHLIQAFYHRTHEEHLAAALPVLEKRDESESTSAVGDASEDSRPSNRITKFAGALFKTAADPHSPLNPFAHDSRRRDVTASNSSRIWLADTKARIPDDLRAELPYLLWLYHMGIILFWIHDSSPKRARTLRLIDQTVDLLDKLISLASNPLMRPVRKRALKLVGELRDLGLAEA